SRKRKSMQAATEALSESGASPPRRSLVLELSLAAGLVLVYFAAARLGFALAYVAEQVTVVWLPAGISLAALVLFGIRFWPAVLLGAFLSNASTGVPLGVAGAIGVGNTLEALCAACLLHLVFNFDPRFARLRDA